MGTNESKSPHENGTSNPLSKGAHRKHNLHMGSPPVSALAAACQSATVCIQKFELAFLANLKTSNLDAVAQVGTS